MSTNMDMPDRQEIMVVGHLNPDTDSICSALAYAQLKERIDPARRYTPCRAGEIGEETAWVLRRFGLPAPRLLEDVAPTVRDVEIRRVEGVRRDITVKEVWEIMRDGDVSTLPIVDRAGRLEGIITLKDLAVAQMDSLDAHAMARAKTPYRNIARVLSGTVVCGSENAVMDRGYILIGAGNTDAIRETVRPGDLVLVANRESAQRAVIEGGAGCMVVCLSAPVSPEIRALAEEQGCVIISTPFDTYKAAYFINQSVPVRHYMVKKGVHQFSLTTPLEDAVRVMGSVRHIYFPVLDDKGKYYGVISRRNLLNRHRKQLILVDHNEKSQCVPGWEQAEIREIVDHHRIGGLQTITPIFFRNQPVGSTATIVAAMYRENGVEPTPAMAGALCCAILSDTLIFRSPTCTETDRQTAQWLAALAGEEPESLGEAMFEAGEDLTQKTADQLLQRDYKIFSAEDITFGVSQSAFFSAKARKRAAAMVRGELERQREADGLECIYYLLTDIGSGSSYVLCAGNGAENVVRRAFGVPDEEGVLRLPGVVSRKKQFIPALMEEFHRRSEEEKQLR